MISLPSQVDIAIIGAGLSGLSAALYCEQQGYNPLILEAGNAVGGRVQSDEVDGFILDHGFQVLLSAYDKASEIFDKDGLQLASFASGALIYDEKGSYRIGDPLRDSSQMLPMLFSRVGSLGDKFRMWKLSNKLKGLSPETCFDGEDISTRAYLQGLGFSEQMMRSFFRPFFGGIFLERALDTPAGMFRFVFRCFSMGTACLPAKGMQALPDQLAQRLQRSTIRLKSRVDSLSQEGLIRLKSGEELQARKVILACDPKSLLPQMDEALSYQRTTCMYFAGPGSLPTMRGYIGLDAREKSAINNFCRLDEVQPAYAPKGQSLWSVTLRDKATESHLQIAESLASLLSCSAADLRHLRSYRIDRALPKIASPRHDIPAEQSQLGSHIYLAGDYLLNASIEAALRSGQRAAEACTETLEKIPA